MSNNVIWNFFAVLQCENVCMILQYLFIYSKIIDSKESNNSNEN